MASQTLTATKPRAPKASAMKTRYRVPASAPVIELKGHKTRLFSRWQKPLFDGKFKDDDHRPNYEESELLVELSKKIDECLQDSRFDPVSAFMESCVTHIDALSSRAMLLLLMVTKPAKDQLAPGRTRFAAAAKKVLTARGVSL